MTEFMICPRCGRRFLAEGNEPLAVCEICFKRIKYKVSKNLAWDKPTNPHNFTGHGKGWIGDTLFDLSTDRPIMRRVALRSLLERRGK